MFENDIVIELKVLVLNKKPLSSNNRPLCMNKRPCVQIKGPGYYSNFLFLKKIPKIFFQILANQFFLNVIISKGLNIRPRAHWSNKKPPGSLVNHKALYLVLSGRPCVLHGAGIPTSFHAKLLNETHPLHKHKGVWENIFAREVSSVKYTFTEPPPFMNLFNIIQIKWYCLLECTPSLPVSEYTLTEPAFICVCNLVCNCILLLL